MSLAKVTLDHQLPELYRGSNSIATKKKNNNNSNKIKKKHIDMRTAMCLMKFIEALII